MSGFLYRKTELRDITARFVNCDRLFMMLSVMPSLRYSVLGSAPTLTNGRTAMAWMPVDRPLHSHNTTPTSSNATPPATQVAVWNRCLGAPATGRNAPVVLDIVRNAKARSRA